MKHIHPKLDILTRVKSPAQRAWICLAYFGRNGLANHAAAGAYGFLLSLMPALMIVAFLYSRIFGLSPEATAKSILDMGLMERSYGIDRVITRFLNTAAGFTGFVSLLSMVWAAIVFAFSMQRGLNSIFFDPENQSNPVKSNLVPLGLEIAVIIFVFLEVWIHAVSVPDAVLWLVPWAGLWLLGFGACRLVPARAPKNTSALIGTLFSVVIFVIFSAFFGLIFNPDRYRQLYGILGSLILLLAKAYFFFMFFFIGAQLAFVIEFFDALLFTRFRTIHAGAADRRHSTRDGGGQRPPEKVFFIDRFLFADLPARLDRYRRRFAAGDTVFHKDEDSHEIYYVLSGGAGVYLAVDGAPKAVIQRGSFFGEMSHVLSNRRSATVRAETELETLALPPELFAEILKIDPAVESRVIKNLSAWLKQSNEQLTGQRAHK